jgi:LysR family glycine cleavage system transcriptional activator
MALQRRLMPSLSELVALEAVARLGSFTKAAEELALTQGALSKQIHQLEATLGLRLFDRAWRQVKLTPGGQGYVEEIQPLLAKLERATRAAVESGRRREVLTCAVPPDFVARWLAPWLGRFADANPGLSVHCRTYLEPFDFEDDSADLAIHVGQPNWAGTQAHRLFDETIIPVASPAYRDALRLAVPADLRRARLIHNAARPALWPVFLDSVRVEAEALGQGHAFDHVSAVAAAAAGGLGVALVPSFAVEAEVAEGRLVPLFGASLRSMDAYLLVVPNAKAADPLVLLFRDWLMRELGARQDPVPLRPRAARPGIPARETLHEKASMYG